jgi:hypothetical protein
VFDILQDTGFPVKYVVIPGGDRANVVRLADGNHTVDTHTVFPVNRKRREVGGDEARVSIHRKVGV